MVLYGDVEFVKSIFRPDEGVVYGADVDARLTEIQKAVAAMIDEKTGVRFGIAPAASARILFAGSGSVLLLPVPVLAVSTVETGGSYSAGGAVDFATLAAASWVLDPVDRDGLGLGIRLLTGSWWGYRSIIAPYGSATPVRVTATWIDAGYSATVPDEITYIANFLMTELLKNQAASPAGFTGPDGAVVPIRNPWNDPMVKTIIEKYRVEKVLVF